jgi:hypothetical protein
MNQNEVLAIAILRGGRSFADAAEISGLSAGLVMELWASIKPTGLLT